LLPVSSCQLIEGPSLSDKYGAPPRSKISILSHVTTFFLTRFHLFDKFYFSLFLVEKLIFLYFFVWSGGQRLDKKEILTDPKIF